MDPEAKRKMLERYLTQIKSKNLKNPVRLNPATVITNIDAELQHIEKAVLHYHSNKILQVFFHKLKTLSEL